MSNVQDVRSRGIDITLEGQKYVLKFDLNAFAELEEAYGSVDQALQALEEGTVKAVRTILWAGLIHAFIDEETGRPTITPYKVGAMIGLNDLKEITEAINKALHQDLPEEAKVEDSKDGEIVPPVEASLSK